MHELLQRMHRGGFAFSKDLQSLADLALTSKSPLPAFVSQLATLGALEDFCKTFYSASTSRILGNTEQPAEEKSLSCTNALAVALQIAQEFVSHPEVMTLSTVASVLIVAGVTRGQLPIESIVPAATEVQEIILRALIRGDRQDLLSKTHLDSYFTCLSEDTLHQSLSGELNYSVTLVNCDPSQYPSLITYLIARGDVEKVEASLAQILKGTHHFHPGLKLPNGTAAEIAVASNAGNVIHFAALFDLSIADPRVSREFPASFSTPTF